MDRALARFQTYGVQATDSGDDDAFAVTAPVGRDAPEDRNRKGVGKR